MANPNGHGGARAGAGRPRRELKTAIENDVHKSKIKTIQKPETENIPTVPECRTYLTEEQKTGVELGAKEYFEELWAWLAERKCEHLFQPSYLQNFAKEIPQLLRSALESQAGLFVTKNADGEPMSFEAGATARLPKGKYWSEIAPTLRADMGDNRATVAFQAGSTIRGNGDSMWEEISPTLRAESHGGDNQPLVIPIDERNATRKGCDNCGTGIGTNGDSAYTVTSEYTGAIAVENHLQDHRLRLTGDTVQSMCRNMGGGGQNVPLVMNRREHAATVSEDVANTQSTSQFKGVQAVCVQGNIIGRKPENGAMGKGANEEISYTLTDADRHAVAYTETAPTLDTGLAHQNSNQIMMNGGAVVEEVYSLTTGGFPQVNEEKSPTLQARDFKSAPVVNNPAFGIDRAAYNQGRNALYKPQIDEDSIHSITAQGPGAVAAALSPEPRSSYVVRRLTPSECLVLMDLPRDWCEGLGNETPTAEDLAFWTNVFETYRRINKPDGKPKTENQIRKFLKKPYSDSACYKMAGNGACVGVIEWVLRGIAETDAI